ncbi:hypothetical protein B566_EDAN011064 [Ephemera danica]|nr:hypothetical protein B566_EDAN011064 [Ephemera danica]
MGFILSEKGTKINPELQEYETSKDLAAMSRFLGDISWYGKDLIYIHTDASDYGIGAQLYLIIDGKFKIIAFASCSLNGAEKVYCIRKKIALQPYGQLKCGRITMTLVNFILSVNTQRSNIFFLPANLTENLRGG